MTNGITDKWYHCCRSTPEKGFGSFLVSVDSHTRTTTSRLYIGLAVRLYVFINIHLFTYFHSCSNFYTCISAGKGLIKKLTVYLAFSVSIYNSYFMIYEPSILSFEKLHYLHIYRTLSDHSFQSIYGLTD